MAGSSETGFTIFMTLLGLYFVGQLLWTLRDISKLPKRERPREKQDYRDFRVLWSSYRAARLKGASITDSLRYADDAIIEFQRTGSIPKSPLPNARIYDEPPPARLSSRILGITQAVLVNAVTVFGVFEMRWPVGTALALYWTETFLATLLLLILLLIWRLGRQVETRGGSIGELLTVSVVFSAAHFVFLFLFLAVILPRYSAGERFDRGSFQVGLLLIGILLLIDFAIHAVTIRKATAYDLQRSAQLHLQRIGVLHLTIIFGMFALALFGSALAFFAVFSALKTLVDLTRRIG